MRYSIITPTIIRSTLQRTIDSVQAQKCRDFEHIIIVDTRERVWPGNLCLKHPARTKVFFCEKAHQNFGNTCRYLAWNRCAGEYLIYLDDDNYLADPMALSRLNDVTRPWAVFPILRYGQVFHNPNPGLLRTDGGQILVKREIGPWPKTPIGSKDYCADGRFIESLVDRFPHTFVDCEPIMVMEKSNQGGML